MSSLKSCIYCLFYTAFHSVLTLTVGLYGLGAVLMHDTPPAAADAAGLIASNALLFVLYLPTSALFLWTNDAGAPRLLVWLDGAGFSDEFLIAGALANGVVWWLVVVRLWRVWSRRRG